MNEISKRRVRRLWLIQAISYLGIIVSLSVVITRIVTISNQSSTSQQKQDAFQTIKRSIDEIDNSQKQLGITLNDIERLTSNRQDAQNIFLEFSNEFDVLQAKILYGRETDNPGNSLLQLEAQIQKLKYSLNENSSLILRNYSHLETEDFASLTLLLGQANQQALEVSDTIKMLRGQDLSIFPGVFQQEKASQDTTILILSVLVCILFVFLVTTSPIKVSIKFQDQIIAFFPEECVAELEALRQELEQENQNKWVYRSLYTRAFLELVIAFYITIPIQNISSLSTTKNRTSKD